MSFLKGRATKKEEQSQVKCVDDTRHIVYDFMRRVPYADYWPASYRTEHEPLMTLKPVLDEYLSKLRPGLDDGTGDVLDNIIADASRRFNISMNDQLIAHLNQIRNFQIQATASIVSFTGHLEQAEAELSEVEEELGRLKALRAGKCHS